MRVIRDLADEAGLESSLSVGGAVVLWMVINGIDGATLRVNDALALIVLSVISTILTTRLILWAQEGLNKYWERIKGTDLQEARIGVGEVLIVLIGLLLWVSLFLPA